ncbi:MAG: hypothetical protein K8E66_11400, partial [Phycisphaerales bacterium]|nr:hypothetical protein [Phycisphaerales bacterium]
IHTTMDPMPARMRTDEPEMNDPHGSDSAHTLTEGGGGTLIGPPPPDTAGKNDQSPGFNAPTARPESAAGFVTEPIVLQRSPGEPMHETAGATGFWDVSDLIGSDGLSGILMAGGVLIIVVILLRRLWRGKRRRHATETPTPREQIAALRTQAENRSRIETFRIEAHDFTRQMAALLDTKAARLEQLIADADDRLCRLAEAEHGSPPQPTRPPKNRTPSIEPTAAVDPGHVRIYQLADSGMDSIEIARQTGQPTGQVELILALRAG